MLPSVKTCSTVGAYPTANPFYLMELHYRVVTLSVQATSKFTYGYVIVQGLQFRISEVDLDIFIKGR